jgi:hypothetical protein
MLASDHDNEYMMLDATIVRAHQHSAAARKKRRAGDRPLARPPRAVPDLLPGAPGARRSRRGVTSRPGCLPVGEDERATVLRSTRYAAGPGVVGAAGLWSEFPAASAAHRRLRRRQRLDRFADPHEDDADEATRERFCTMDRDDQVDAHALGRAHAGELACFAVSHGIAPWRYSASNRRTLAQTASPRRSV